jgi:hypothetical protein
MYIIYIFTKAHNKAPPTHHPSQSLGPISIQEIDTQLHNFLLLKMEVQLPNVLLACMPACCRMHARMLPRILPTCCRARRQDHDQEIEARGQAVREALSRPQGRQVNSRA